MLPDPRRLPPGKHRFIRYVLVSLASTCLVMPAATQRVLGQVEYESQPSVAPPPPAAQVDENGAEVLTSGPIHEAFANPSELDPTEPPVIDKPPPEPIPEEPPEYKPEGDYIWIPGYWMWDDDRGDYIWISGVWRQPPPGMQWVTGYWTEIDGGWQRVEGFWTSVEAPEIAYQEPPPETLDVGPTSPAPDDNHFWVPGIWVHQDSGFRWRAGYWSPYQPNWIWYPARWVWTPAGCIFKPGFWDYRVAVRGQCFAPVYFHRSVLLRPRWVYRPWCVISPDNLFVHLWLRPGWGHYYFGNYYGPRYASLGFQPWAIFPTRGRLYDPLFVYSRVHYHRHGIDFIGRVRGWHEYYGRHPDLRPPRTWRDYTRFVAQARTDDRLREHIGQAIVARDLHDVARRDDFPIQLTRVDNRARQRLVERATRLRELNEVRRRTESQAARLARQGERTADRNQELQQVTRELREALRLSRQEARDAARDVTRTEDQDLAREARDDARDLTQDRRDDRRMARGEGRDRGDLPEGAERRDVGDLAERTREAREDAADVARERAAEVRDRIAQGRGDVDRPGETAQDDQEPVDPTARIRERMPDMAGEVIGPARRREAPTDDIETPRGVDRPGRGLAQDAADELPRINRERSATREARAEASPNAGRPEAGGPSLIDRAQEGRPRLARTPGEGPARDADRPEVGRAPALDRTPGLDRARGLDPERRAGRVPSVELGPEVERGPAIDRGIERGPRVGARDIPGTGDGAAERRPSIEREALRPDIPAERPLVTPDRRPEGIREPAVRPPLDERRIESIEPREVPYPRGSVGRPAVTPQLQNPRGASPRPAPVMNLPSTDTPSPRLEAPGASPPVATPRDVQDPRPVIERPAPERGELTPSFERLSPSVERRVQRPVLEGAAPRVERSTPAPRIERSEPAPRIERSAPAPRAERSAPAPRVERSAPRIERSAPRASSDRGGGGQGGGRGRGKGKDD